MKKYAEITVALPVEGPFSYSIPDELKESVKLGMRVLVPFGRRSVTGYVTALSDTAAVDKVRPVIDVLDPAPVFDAKGLKFFSWMSSYYQVSLGDVLSLTHPSSAKVETKRYFHIAEGVKGEPEKTANIKGAQCKLLDALTKRRTLSSLKKEFPRLSVNSVLNTLKNKGLVEEVIKLSGTAEKKEKAIRLLSAEGKEVKVTPKQGELMKLLNDKDWKSLSNIRKELKGADSVVKALDKKGLVEVTELTVTRDPIKGTRKRLIDFEATKAQTQAIKKIKPSIATGGKGFSAFLLNGITGSGKSYVYFKAIEEALRVGKRALLLVPEIALTGSVGGYLKEMFPGSVALIHSGLSDGEKYDQWRRILTGEAKVVLGARSALFMPIKDLALIIVDEEHDTSYKQEDALGYSARDCALMMGKTHGITVVLGSATPSVETYKNAQDGKIEEIKLTDRVGGGELPEVEVVSLKEEKGAIISERLRELMEATFKDKGQVLLFLNRRGFSHFLMCRDCGHSFKCVNCSVTLTFHKKSSHLKCHYCDFTATVPDECPKCGSYNIIDPGFGTEKVVHEIESSFPDARILRLDRDTARKKGEAERILEEFELGGADVLVGTQMVAKGHHFPALNLVGIISADTSLNIPDFRSAERTFQLISQALGRAGREKGGARVVVQSLSPEHYCLRSAVAHDYKAFYSEEKKLREDAGYPPFSRLALLRLEGTMEGSVIEAARILRDITEKKVKELGVGKSIRCLGPAPAMIPFLKGRHRLQILIKSSSAKALSRFIFEVRREFKNTEVRGAALFVDIDPSMV
ncbi:MAG: primosomal protein N' [Deltaproteobacteria bacterium]|nr:primosomal protein N' [Deltaproteobacteria bacterium]